MTLLRINEGKSSWKSISTAIEFSKQINKKTDCKSVIPCSIFFLPYENEIIPHIVRE